MTRTLTTFPARSAMSRVRLHAGSCVAAVVAVVTAMTAFALPARAQRSSATGWVGMSVIQKGHGDNSSGVSMDYPVIASVEPGSPAQTAGLVAGDTVLSYNDVDAHTEPLGMRRFLKPGERMVVKIRRNGVRALALTVAKRSGWNASRMNVTVEARDAEPQPMGPLPVAAPFASRGGQAFAGAQITRLNSGLASVLNVREAGVLVLDVVAGTPAMRSGLQPGDVITRADTNTILGPLELLRALRAAAGHPVALAVSRRGKQQTITLHW